MTEENKVNHLTLAMIKPHAIRARKVGEIISRMKMQVLQSFISSPHSFDQKAQKLSMRSTRVRISMKT